MSEQLGTGGLILNEPLLWHKGAKGRIGMSIPASDVPPAEIARAKPRAALSLATPLLLLAFLLLLAEAALTLAGRTRGPNERATQP